MPKHSKHKDEVESMGMYCGCCVGANGLIHVVGGIGVGLLVVHYIGVKDITIWGWGLVAISLLGHLFGKTHC